jgi:hypothetical protein
MSGKRRHPFTHGMARYPANDIADGTAFIMENISSCARGSEDGRDQEWILDAEGSQQYTEPECFRGVARNLSAAFKISFGNWRATIVISLVVLE